ncbi:tryptophan dimethylallyltransferase family protein [Archangium lipolyticum]|uniref:tryptophan dimethylallyltransferase family protein n=1 Tax=Archangium lipolyticum TaxID=2970465 RepID=UPI00214A756F|nr:tryptophan dimethylallyltransferase family protein [Archangium lipolyticum]
MREQGLLAGTLIASGSERLTALARAMGFDEPSTQAMRSLFLTLASSWGELPVGRAPPWPSDVCDDHSPFELSVAIDAEGPQLRVLVEPMDAPFSLSANRAASLRLHEELARTHGLHLERLRALEGLLMPEDARGRFVAWHSAAFSPGHPVDFKVYFNLLAHGPGHAARLTEEALHRIGFHQAWSSVAEVMGRREAGADEPVYFALDLSPRADARAKLYFRHHRATAAFLEEVCALGRHHQPGVVTEFCRRMAGGGEGPYGGKGPVTCLSFSDPSDARPQAVTVYFPVSHHARDDREIRQRITGYLQSQELATGPYLAALESSARRPLEAGTGIHTYAAVRWQGKPRVTVYFSPETYGMMRQPSREAPAVEVARPATEIVDHFEAHSVADHPFFARMHREPVRLEVLARLLANFRVGITREFPRRLAWLTARAPDERIRSVLAKQLNDELGNGDFTRAHRGLFERMFEVLAPWAPPETEEVLAPGHALGAELERCYVSAEPYEGVGASLVVEVYGKQVDTFVADQFRRQKEIPPSALEWLHLHETLEVEHASESMDIARLIPTGPASEAAWRGARAVATASRAFFDALYRACYP